MTPEDVARRYDRRGGFELIDYSHVALPLYRLTVDSVTMVHRDLMPIKEFVMRAIDAGLYEASEVSNFLGLDQKTVLATLADLRDSGYANLSDEGTRGALIARGKQVLAEAKESLPQDEMLTFLYDRLRRKPVNVSVEQLMYPAEVDPQTTIEIRPYPVDGPEVSDLVLPEIQRLFTNRVGRKSFGRDILRFRKIVRRARLFRRAIGLLYRRPRTSEIQLAFVIDGSSDQELEHAFAVAGGPKKMGFVRLIDESTTSSQLRKHLGSDVVRLIPDVNAIEDDRRQVSLARFKLQTLRARAERSPQDAATVAAAAAALDVSEGRLRDVAARPIRLFEAVELFHEALEKSTHFLAISSKSISTQLVGEDFSEKIRIALERGVTTRITLNDAVDVAQPLIIELERLRLRFENLILEIGRSSNFFHVVSDTKFAVVCNRPLLSNAARVRQFGQFSGYALFSPDLVDGYSRRIARQPKG